jgi:hypothetical protein
MTYASFAFPKPKARRLLAKAVVLFQNVRATH